jgi:inner membrane protein
MVRLNAPWPHPSFTGNTLPQTSNITDTGFTATWKSLAHNRPFAQYGTDGAFTEAQLADAAFGVDLFIPVNGYQKTMRSVKYAALCIVLTFAAFFLIETTHNKSVHPFHYGLIGLALVLFYMLLLSISEYTGFNVAYGIAAVATITLIGWFVKGVLASGKLSGLLSLLLLLVYAYVFTILQLQDFALLLGSIGLFISLAAIMYFSKKWSW